MSRNSWRLPQWVCAFILMCLVLFCLLFKMNFHSSKTKYVHVLTNRRLELMIGTVDKHAILLKSHYCRSHQICCWRQIALSLYVLHCVCFLFHHSKSKYIYIYVRSLLRSKCVTTTVSFRLMSDFFNVYFHCI